MRLRCPSGEKLGALLANCLVDAEAAELAEHVGTCAACRGRLAEMAGGGNWLEPQHLPQPDSEPPWSPRLRAVMDRLRSLPVAGEQAATEEEPGEAGIGFLDPCDQPGVLGRFGPYEIIEEIARGGMGIVLKARDPALDRIVAIKVLAPALAASREARARFLGEARAAAAISHDHVVDIHAVDETKGLPYLVMQFISGQTLAERVRKSGPLELDEILRIGNQVASGLAAAHAHGLIHRDIKPGNILLENSVERARITDFGLAQVADEVGSARYGLATAGVTEDLGEKAEGTRSGWLAGTPEFMAPEQARGQPVDYRADLFSFGGVLYFMATGSSPFAGESLLSVIRRVCEEEPRPLCEVNPTLPEWFGAIVGQLLAKDPARRPQSAAQVAQALQDHLAQVQRSSLTQVSSGAAQSGNDRMEAPAAPRRRWTLRRWVAAVGLVAAGLAVVVFQLVSLRTGPTTVAPQAAFRVVRTEDRVAEAFATFEAAVLAARSGDTIEVGVNRLYRLDPIDLGDKALVLHAAAGVHPILVCHNEAKALFSTRALLVLEGLTFRANVDRRSLSLAVHGHLSGPIVSSTGAPLFAAHCRFEMPAWTGPPIAQSVLLTQSPYAELRNCEVYTRNGSGVAMVWETAPSGSDSTKPASRLVLDNCVQTGDAAVSLDLKAPVRAAVELIHNTLVVQTALVVPALQSNSTLTVTAGTNVFACHALVRQGGPMGAGNLNDRLDWKDAHNLFAFESAFSGTDFSSSELCLEDLPAWNRYWNQTNTGSVAIRLRIGVAIRKTPLESLAIRSFKLTPTHYDAIAAAGGDRAIAYGATYEPVGPGPAYDKWRSSPGYRQWQERIGRWMNREGP